jgi:hypothetical protein
MKAERKHDYFIEGFGNVIFIKVDIGSGHCTFKVFWRRIGEEKSSFIAWLPEGLKPSAKLAVFYCNLACAVEDGLDRYYYHDKCLVPPKREGLQRNSAA